MRQMWRGQRNAPRLGEFGEPATAADGGSDRRGASKLSAAAAGGVAGSGILSVSSTALGTVRGTVSGPGVTDFSGCVVLLQQIGGSGGEIGPVSSGGSYKITGVPAGKWRAFCVPSGGTPLAVMTYKQKPGYNSGGTAITVAGSQTVTANFSLHPAGKLQVIVNDPPDPLVPGIYVCVYEAGSKAAAVLPTATGSDYYAVFANVPLTCKVFVIDPYTNGFTWWDGAQSWAAATVVTLPGQGEGISITATITGP